MATTGFDNLSSSVGPTWVLLTQCVAVNGGMCLAKNKFEMRTKIEPWEAPEIAYELYRIYYKALS